MLEINDIATAWQSRVRKSGVLICVGGQFGVCLFSCCLPVLLVPQAIAFTNVIRGLEVWSMQSQGPSTTFGTDVSPSQCDGNDCGPCHSNHRLLLHHLFCGAAFKLLPIRMTRPLGEMLLQLELPQGAITDLALPIHTISLEAQQAQTRSSKSIPRQSRPKNLGQ